MPTPPWCWNVPATIPISIPSMSCSENIQLVAVGNIWHKTSRQVNMCAVQGALSPLPLPSVFGSSGVGKCNFGKFESIVFAVRILLEFVRMPTNKTHAHNNILCAVCVWIEWHELKQNTIWLHQQFEFIFCAFPLIFFCRAHSHPLETNQQRVAKTSLRSDGMFFFSLSVSAACLCWVQELFWLHSCHSYTAECLSSRVLQVECRILYNFHSANTPRTQSSETQYLLHANF